MSPCKTVLFVCIENSCRSQMAEAFTKMLEPDTIDAYSCGTRPTGLVNERAIFSMNTIGYDMGMHHSKSWDTLPLLEFDLLVTMGCGDACPDIKAKERVNWAITDPKTMPTQQFDQVRDLIREKVLLQISDLQNQESPATSNTIRP